MIEISRHLGVTCNHCHDTSNFKDARKQEFKTTLAHMKIVSLLNKSGFTGKKDPKADCYMCHRGKHIPDYKEPLKK